MEETNKSVLIPASKVEGNITSCETKKELIHVDRTRALQFTQKETYMVYDVCTRQEISRYTTKSFTTFGVISIALVFMFFLLIVIAFIDSHDY